jgi:cellulose synthase/poly-beta-1,6-N-acetylglucosamine synthase-like glycosyltransferase
MDVREAVVTLLQWSQWAVIGYFLLLNTILLLLIAVAGQTIPRHARRRGIAGTEDTAVSPFTRSVSIVASAYNEEATIVESVQAMLSLRYPAHEVVVVVDGAKDRTFDVLAEAFDLVETDRVQPCEIPVIEHPTSIHVSGRGDPLTVVRKPNSGRADSLNVGIDLARHPLICMVDADSLLDPDALLVISQPFADDPLRVVSAGGVIRPVNDSVVRRGRVLEPRIPRRWLPRIQVVEYLRAFLMGRTGWARLGGLLIISGAFGLYRRDILVEVGGLDPHTIGEDFELVVRTHRHMRDTKRPYRVVFIPEPVCWTEVPDTRAVLARQRRRWHRGLYETLVRHRGMLRPGYGVIGFLALPYFILFELLAPLIEVLGLALVVAGFASGVISPGFALLFMLAAFGYGTVVSLVAVLLDELGLHRYKRLTDLGAITFATVLENAGYRQITALWRLQGWWAALRGGKPVWGEMTRSGFASTATTPPLSSGTHATVPEPQNPKAPTP